jgi:hypothetical protein
MYCYLRWARNVTTMTFDEIIAKVMDRALSDYLRRDSAWRALRAEILSQQETSDWREILSEERGGPRSGGPRGQ